jgi:hypothetical protein
MQRAFSAPVTEAAGASVSALAASKEYKSSENEDL